MKEKAPFGYWNSPLTPEMTSRADISSRNTDIVIDKGNVYWTEPRPHEKGRIALMCLKKNSSLPVEILPPHFDVRTKVHEYGGAPFTVYQGDVYFIHVKDQILYRLASDGSITPQTNGKIRIADMLGTPHGIVAVAEEGLDNYLILLNLNGTHAILDKGHDFYSSPALSPDGNHLAWLTWDHPNMPWDGTQLWQAKFTQGKLYNKALVAGGTEESIFQPRWSPLGNLFYISDRTGWWNIYKGSDNQCSIQAEFGLPQWKLGTSTWGFTGQGEQILCISQQHGSSSLNLLNHSKLEKLDLPYTNFSQLAVENGKAVMLMGSPTMPRKVMKLDIETRKLTQVETSDCLSLDMSLPQHIQFPTTHGQVAYGFFYPPLNADYEGPLGKLPPLIVFSHGGPTGCAESTYNLKIQYWTSRGFAILDVNYRGSTGYGRAYRNSLRGQWGVFDVDDCEQGALYLAAKGLVDKNHLFIRGSSAGGYTTLAALAFKQTFAAGACYYGVGDLLLLAKDTHKFEAKYMDWLIGPLPASQQIYKDRSPLLHAGKISCPVIFFHGENDKVIPKDQSIKMYQTLLDNHIKAELIIYENEEHGFRQAKHIEDSLTKELCFYQKNLS